MYDDEPQKIHETARQLVRRGISVIPTGGGISKAAKEPHAQALIASGHSYVNEAGKTRPSWKPMQFKLPTERDLDTWYVQARARGLAIVTGQLSGYVVIDVDRAGLPLMAELGWTPHVISPSGGAHLYLNWPGWFVQSAASKNKKTLPPGIDVRGDGGYIMFPPSRNRAGTYHRTDQRRKLTIDQVPESVTVEGKTYQLRRALGLTPPEPAPAPVFVGRQYDPPHVDDDRCPIWLLLDRAADYAPESRNKGAFMLGLWANANGYRLEEALIATHDYQDMVRGVKGTPFTLEEAQKAVRSAYTYERKAPWKREEER